MEKVRDVICKNFKRLVGSSELTTKTIAKMAKVSEPTIYRWISGENTPELANIEAVAKVLNVDPFEFYRTDEPRPVPRSFKIKALSEYLEAVPDRIYELAQDVPHGDEIWDIIEESLRTAASARKESNNGKKKSNH